MLLKEWRLVVSFMWWSCEFVFEMEGVIPALDIRDIPISAEYSIASLQHFCQPGQAIHFLFCYFQGQTKHKIVLLKCLERSRESSSSISSFWTSICPGNSCMFRSIFFSKHLFDCQFPLTQLCFPLVQKAVRLLLKSVVANVIQLRWQGSSWTSEWDGWGIEPMGVSGEKKPMMTAINLWSFPPNQVLFENWE